MSRLGFRYRFYTSGNSFGHSFFVNKNGHVFGWGNNEQGQLDTGNTYSKFSPFRTFKNFENGTSKVKSIHVGCGHAIILLTNGKCYSIGRNYGGQLCLSDLTHRKKPTFIKLLKDLFVTSVYSGVYHNIFLVKSDNYIRSNGCNDMGQLGNNNRSNQTGIVLMINRKTKTYSKINVKHMILGRYYTFIQSKIEKVYKCGKVHSDEIKMTLSELKLNDEIIDRMYGGYEHVFFITKGNGNVYCMGSNNDSRISKVFRMRTISEPIMLPILNGRIISDMKCGDFTSILLNNGNVIAMGSQDKFGMSWILSQKKGELFDDYNTEYGIKTIMKDVIQIENTKSNIFMIKQNGEVYVRGANSRGSCGIQIESKSDFGSRVIGLMVNPDLNVNIRNIGKEYFDGDNEIKQFRQKLFDKIMAENFIDLTLKISK